MGAAFDTGVSDRHDSRPLALCAKVVNSISPM